MKESRRNNEKNSGWKVGDYIKQEGMGAAYQIKKFHSTSLMAVNGCGAIRRIQQDDYSKYTKVSGFYSA